MLDKKKLPTWFEYPFEHRFVTKNGLFDMEVWIILSDDVKEHAYVELVGKRLPKRALVPFAKRTDSDICACWERGQGERVLLIDPFIGEGFEDFSSFDTYWDWFRHGVDEMIDYAKEEKELGGQI